MKRFRIVFVCLCSGSGSAIPVRDSSVYGSSTAPIFLDDVICAGNEGNLLQCSFTRQHNCEQSDAAGVVCGGMNVESGLHCCIFQRHFSLSRNLLRRRCEAFLSGRL